MAGGATDVRVLGPFELVHDGQVMPVGGPVGQAIVTVLACRPDMKVLPAELITMVWGDPNAASAETLYSHVTRLRRVLSPAGLAIVGHRPGYEQALASARRTGNPPAAQNALNGLGYVHYYQGRFGPAAECFEQALAGARQTGGRTTEQTALIGLGYVQFMRGRYGPAAECFEQALSVARQSGDRNAQFEAHHGLGRVHHATGRQLDALHHQHTALRLVVELDQLTDRARVHDGLAHTHHALGDLDQARQHWQAALDLLAGVGTDHTGEPGVTTAAIRTHVHDLGSPSTPG